jgi:O-antigen/teichoic acid export membrane protein
MANTVVTTGLGFCFWIIIARFYDKADIGLGTAVISAMGLLVLLSNLGFDTVILRFLSKAEKPVELINSCLTIPVAVSLFIAVIFVIGVNIWSPALIFIRDNIIFAVAFIFFTASLTLSPMIDYIFIAKRRASFVLSKNTIISLLRITLPFILVLFFRAFGIVSSLGIATAITVIIYLLIVLPRVQSGYKPMLKIDRSVIRDVRRYSINNYVVSLLGAAPSYIIPILIVNRLGAEDNAYFYISSMIASALSLIPVAVAQSLFAESSHLEDQLKRNVERSYKFAFILLVPIIVFLLLCGKWLLMAFGPAYSENGSLLLRILAISSIFIAINTIYNTILYVKRRLGELIALVGFTSVSLLLAIYFLTPTTGIVGIGYAMIAANGIVSVYIITALRRLR